VGDATRKGISSHFSETGMFVQCDQPAPLKSSVRLSIQFSNLDKPIEVQGEVVWTNAHGPDDSVTPRGMGVKFSQAEDPDILRILGEMATLYDTLDNPYYCYYS
jgi:Tfp pilus assembly protein PilZ